MKKLFLVLLTVLFLSGCINITEEIFLEKNGSGKYAMTMDLEKAVEMMDMLKSFAPDSLAGDVKEGNILDSVKDNFKVFDSIPGITNVKKEQKGNVFTVSFDFKDIATLNEAMRKRNKKTETQKDLYTFAPGSFSFQDTTAFGMNDAMKELDGAGSADSSAAAMEMFKSMIGDMNYTTIYHLPGKVSSFSNKEAKLDPDGKTLRLTVNLLERSKQMTLENNIRFQK
ncbi:MAG: hypothetical protein WBP58_11425 [Chitinophagaceae bacterium]